MTSKWTWQQLNVSDKKEIIDLIETMENNQSIVLLHTHKWLVSIFQRYTNFSYIVIAMSFQTMNSK